MDFFNADGLGQNTDVFSQPSTDYLGLNPTSDPSAGAAPAPSAAPSDTQSNGIFNILGSLGTAYIGADAQKTAAKANANAAVATAAAQIDATGRAVGAVPTTAAVAGQWIPGLSNTMVLAGGGAVVGLVILLVVLRK